MDRVGANGAGEKTTRILGCVTAALMFAAVAVQPGPARAAHAGAGGLHGGGLHGGGFHGGGFHGGFHAGGFRGGGFHGGFAAVHNGFGRGFEAHRFHGQYGVGYGLWWGPGLAYAYPYSWDYYYPDYGYYDNGEPYAGQYWYYCSDPAGYYPYVTQCYSGWQAVPAG